MTKQNKTKQNKKKKTHKKTRKNKSTSTLSESEHLEEQHTQQDSDRGELFVSLLLIPEQPHGILLPCHGECISLLNRFLLRQEIKSKQTKSREKLIRRRREKERKRQI